MPNSTFPPANAHGPPGAISNSLIFICDIISYALIFISDHILFLAFSFILGFHHREEQCSRSRCQSLFRSDGFHRRLSTTASPAASDGAGLPASTAGTGVGGGFHLRLDGLGNAAGVSNQSGGRCGCLLDGSNLLGPAFQPQVTQLLLVFVSCLERAQVPVQTQHLATVRVEADDRKALFDATQHLPPPPVPNNSSRKLQCTVDFVLELLSAHKLWAVLLLGTDTGSQG